MAPAAVGAPIEDHAVLMASSMAAEPPLPPPMPTLSDVARWAGVSVATASRALNGHPTVARDRAHRVRSAAEALGYIPDATARTFSGGLSSVVAVVLCCDRPVPLSVIQGAIAEAATSNLTVLISDISDDGEDPRAALRRIRSHRPRALVLVGDDDALDIDIRGELAIYQTHGGKISRAALPSGQTNGDASTWWTVGQAAIREAVRQ